MLNLFIKFLNQELILSYWKCIVIIIISILLPILLFNLQDKNKSKKEYIRISSNELKKDENTIENVNDNDNNNDNVDDNLINKFCVLDGRFKMVLLVNMSLKMEKGKIAAQCGHATLGCYQIAMKKCPSAVSFWQLLGQAKIALKVQDDAAMLEIQKKAIDAGIMTYLVRDAGHTQVEPMSRTVLAIGPAPIKEIDDITGKLKLL